MSTMLEACIIIEKSTTPLRHVSFINSPYQRFSKSLNIIIRGDYDDFTFLTLVAVWS